jgi:hypothetical protein
MCEVADRLGKVELFLELDELDHITARSTAEAMEKSLVTVNVEGGSLFGVKWAEPLITSPGFF